MNAPTDDELNALAIPWHGGEQPVPDGTLAYVKLKSGWWPTPGVFDARSWRSSDIAAYVLASTVNASISYKELDAPASAEKAAHPAPSLTKRELFSAMMLHALLSSPSCQVAALYAVQWADSLINELGKEPK